MIALAVLELMSIPDGIRTCDAMLKAANVNLVCAQAVCAGKYIVIVSGEVAAVSESTEVGKTSAGVSLVDSALIASVHEDVISAINACSEVGEIAALGVSETYSVASAVIAADAMVKAANVKLIEVRLGRGLGGKAFIVLTGEVSAVQSALDTAQTLEETQGMLSKSVLIPSPHKELIKSIL